MTTLNLNFDPNKYYVEHKEQNCRGVVEEIKLWIQNDNIDIPSNLTDAQIIIFTETCNHDIKSTQELMKKYYDLRKWGCELFTDRNLKKNDNLIKQMNRIRAALSPVPTDEGYRVLFFSLNDPLPEHYHMDLATVLVGMIIDRILYDGPVKGLVIVYDATNVQLGHMTRFQLNVLRKIMHYIQECMPCHIINFHVINTVPFVDKIMTVLRPLLKKSLLQLIIFYQPGDNLEQLYEKVPRKCLLSNFGGDLPDMDTLHNILFEELERLLPYFIEEEQQRSSKKTTDTFVPQFKQLEID